MNKNIQKYLAFVKSAEHESLTKAAEELNYSNSGISRMIKDLESDWNISLLERSRSGVRLTSDGVKIFPYVKQICIEYQNLEYEIDNINGLDSGIIRIGSFSSPATYWLPNIFKEFQAEYPNIICELLIGNYSEIDSWITQGRIDCGFVLLPGKPDYDTIWLQRDRLMVVLPENHPLLSYDIIPIQELNHTPFILSKSNHDSEVEELLNFHNIKPDIRFTTWDDYAIMAMVEKGLGISILSELILSRNPYNIVLRPLDVPSYREIGLAMRDRKTIPRAMKRFLDFLQFK